MVLKPRIAGDRNRTGAGSLVVSLKEGAAEKGGHTKDGKVVAGNKIDVRGLVRGADDGSLAGELGAIYCRYSCIGFSLAAEILKKRIREELRVAIRDRHGQTLDAAVAKQDEFARILDGQRPEKDGIDQRENRRVGSDTEGEGE